MNAAVICFTAKGLQTADRIREAMQNECGTTDLQAAAMRVKIWCKKKELPAADHIRVHQVPETLTEWTGQRFADSELIIFVGAAGIAVRSIAPYVVSKTHDPAVLCIDEKGTFVISLLSGHIGRANEWTAALAAELEAIPVITTATDLNQKFAVDVFARANALWISDMTLAKEISAVLLDGKKVGFVSEVPVYGTIPKELVQPEDVMQESYAQEDFREDTEGLSDLLIRVINPISRMHGREKAEKLAAAERTAAENMTAEVKGSEEKKERPEENTEAAVQMDGENSSPMRELILIPRCLTLGVGCRKGKDSAEFAHSMENILRWYGIDEHAVKQVCSLDLKAEEEAILRYCQDLDLPFTTFTAAQLQEAPGIFHASAFVEKTTGVDNVCERSAVCGSCPKGFLIMEKVSDNGMTVAAAGEPVHISF